MSNVVSMALLVSCVFVIGCATEPQPLPSSLANVRVSTTYDPEVVFPQSGTYGFLHLQAEPDEALVYNFEEVDNRIREALQKNLATKGFKLGAGDDMKYLVSYRVLLEPEYEMEILNPFDEDWKAVAKMKEHAKGALVVKVHKMPSAVSAWIGIFDATILVGRDLSEEEKDSEMAYIVNKLMDSFPPKK